MGNRKNILIIEDNELNMKLAVALLKMDNFETTEASDAETGIQMAKAIRPDLILMDIQLPGMDGLTATRLIKEDEELRAIPVIALTSYAMQGDEDKAIDAGCIGYIPKPIDTRNFVRTIEKSLVG